MAIERLTRWANLAKIVAVLVSVITFTLGGGFLWNHVWHVPNLVYTILPSYEVGGQSFSGLVIENRGRDTAHDVLIKIFDLDTEIEALRIESDELATIREGGQGTRGVTIWLDRITDGSSVMVYILTKPGVALEGHISITAEEGRAVPISAKQASSRFASILLVAAISAFILASVGISVFSINYLRDRETRRQLEMKARELKLKEAEAEIAARERAIVYEQVIAALKSLALDEDSTREFIRLAFKQAERPSHGKDGGDR